MNISKKKEIITFLKLLGFKNIDKKDIVFEKEYKSQKYIIKVDLSKGKHGEIFYRSDDKTTIERIDDGQIQRGDKTTSNFSEKENFVVLEVVNRLLEKGYHPNDIHLERRYPSGRGASGGKSDVCVYDKEKKSLIIIECKTWGDEFEKEKQKMQNHGGQLFAYLTNDKNTKFLVLYASRIYNNDIEYENLILHIKDREEDLKKNIRQIEEENIKLYRDANNKSELFEVWKESFNLYFHFNGIFDDDTNAYSLELKAIKKKNLKPLGDAQGLFNKFAEILRHNNISDNANAFNKILSLFLCKIVDEEKNDEEILDFQVKEDEEYENLIDRLQKLYQKGMKKLNEEIVYYSEKDLKKIIRLYPAQTPIEDIEDIFRELKYYTNNEFAFKEVHNKKLFIQNGRVLTEVVKLLQNYKFKYSTQQQVLGDFFELMLNHGVKQSEGQFFTPIPIVKFIILSLGFDEIVKDKLQKDDNYLLPKILDYACGAGHFLTESIDILQNVIKQADTSNLSEYTKKRIAEYKDNTEWTKDYIFGIEKDYRLARTSQIACYINGDGDTNIIFGDGLEEHQTLQMDKKKFDVVVANPPYSVAAFKNYLNVGKTDFELFDSFTEKSREIEAMFVERTKQVLQYSGVAGIILPATILDNRGVYEKAREVLLKNFEIRAIAELGGSTFLAAKGVSTVVLFLKRRDDKFLKDREYIANDVFDGIHIDTEKRYIKEKKIVELFCKHRGFDFKDYIRFLKLEINDRLLDSEMFAEYKEVFDSSTEKKDLQKKTYFKKYTEQEKEEELNKRFYDYCKTIEKEKFLYFMLCLSDANFNIEAIEDYYKPQQTVIVKTGNNINKEKEYLGYEFQGKKGSEGIKIINYGGKLFDAENPKNPKKANSYIRDIIINGTLSTQIDNEQKENIGLFRLIDLLDFNKVEFDKKINSNKKITIQTRWNLVKIGDVCTLQAGKTPSRNKKNYWNNGTIKWLKIVDFKDFDEVYSTSEKITELAVKETGIKILPKETILVTIFATIGRVGILKEPMATNQAIVGLKTKHDNINNIFLMYVIKFYVTSLIEQASGSAQPNINSTILKNMKIPLPPLEVQEEIVSEIKKIEKEEKEALKQISQKESEIRTELKEVIAKKKKVKLDKLCIVQSGGTPSRKESSYWENGTIDWLRSEVCQNCYVKRKDVKEKITQLGLEKSSAKLFQKDTILMALVGATIGRVAYLTFEASTNQNIAGIYPKDATILNPKFLFYVLMESFESNFGGRKGKFTMANLTMIKNIEIPIVNIEEQNKLILKINAIEKNKTSLKLTADKADKMKQNILKSYLN